MSIDELESLAPYQAARDVTLIEVLGLKMGKGYELLSIWEAFNEEYRKRPQFVHRDNADLETRFSKIAKESLARFASGRYGPVKS